MYHCIPFRFQVMWFCAVLAFLCPCPYFCVPFSSFFFFLLCCAHSHTNAKNMCFSCSYLVFRLLFLLLTSSVFQFFAPSQVCQKQSRTMKIQFSSWNVLKHNTLHRMMKERKALRSGCFFLSYIPNACLIVCNNPCVGTHLVCDSMFGPHLKKPPKT